MGGGISILVACIGIPDSRPFAKYDVGGALVTVAGARGATGWLMGRLLEVVFLILYLVTI